MESETTSAAKMTVKIYLEGWTWKDDFGLVFVFFFWDLIMVRLVDLFESKADCTKQTVTFLLKAWALLPKAASVGGCFAFGVSFGLKRTPEERFTYKRVHKVGVTNSSIFGFIFFLSRASRSLLA